MSSTARPQPSPYLAIISMNLGNLSQKHGMEFMVSVPERPKEVEFNPHNESIGFRLECSKDFVRRNDYAKSRASLEREEFKVATIVIATKRLHSGGAWLLSFKVLMIKSWLTVR
ncbi:hypothetical protein N7541_003495 [Penicillium brevicompactum]|uniref:Uncharacterized protein n=1 Tax=Penicillium brevicompactum TaxID=5074 RepID=A0A9W9V1E8_PENBR|nr:hypothetical protein N7541_003495 [Penicillium brevicompactum]